MSAHQSVVAAHTSGIKSRCDLFLHKPLVNKPRMSAKDYHLEDPAELYQFILVNLQPTEAWPNPVERANRIFYPTTFIDTHKPSPENIHSLYSGIHGEALAIVAECTLQQIGHKLEAMYLFIVNFCEWLSDSQDPAVVKFRETKIFLLARRHALELLRKRNETNTAVERLEKALGKGWQRRLDPGTYRHPYSMRELSS